MAKFAVATRSAMLAPAIAHFNSGKLRIYAGSRPANADASIGAATLLAELTLNSTSFTESGGVLTAGAISPDASADANGTAAFARIWRSDGTTAVVDLSVGTSGAELNLVSTLLAAGAPVNVTSLTITFGVGA